MPVTWQPNFPATIASRAAKSAADVEHAVVSAELDPCEHMLGLEPAAGVEFVDRREILGLQPVRIETGGGDCREDSVLQSGAPVMTRDRSFQFISHFDPSVTEVSSR